MNKPKVVFTYVEAGMGHIMPITSISNAFEKKYGKYVEIVRSKFFSETGDKQMIKFERGFVNDVKAANSFPPYGFLETFFMNAISYRFLGFLFYHCYNVPVVKKAIKHMEELQADMVVSTHFSPTLIANKVKTNKPIIVSYNPDVYLQPFYRNDGDLVLISTQRGYEHAMKYKKRFNKENFKCVPFAIREKAFELFEKKDKTKKELGLDGRLTIILFEGGYGIGKTKKIVEILAKTDMKLNVIAICGSNEKAYKALKKLTPSESINLIVEGFSSNVLEYLSCADIFMGKSGASSVAEPAFFGVAEIITNYATFIEKGNAKYYVKDVKNAVIIKNPKKAVKKVRELYENPALLNEMKANALKIHDKYGSEESADALFELLCKRFPNLKEEYDKDNAK